ncbi:MAG: PAS domain S-box protein [Gammaproteobacteria bacterium]|nr:PAS domain S-box protein [Gammaproteobacteria bacterium]
MLKINIRTKLVLGLVIVLLINLGIGFYAFGLYNEQSKRAAQICALSFQIVETSLSAQVHFKKQVQEWKNVLLRGYDTALYDKYLKQFYQQERITQALIRKLIPLISGHSEAQEIAKEFLRVHTRLGHEYRQALTLYSNVDDEIYWRSDGTHFPVEYRSFPIHHDDQLHGAVVNFSDITERKSAETNLRQAHAALAQERAALAERVRDRTEELRITNAELARSVRAKDEFLAAMSHELRTPLTSILGNTEILIDQHKGALNEGQRRSLKTIEESANHLLALINDILDVAKVEAGKMPLAWDQVPVKQLCEASLRLIRQSAEHKSQQLSSNIDPEVHIVSGDSRRLKQLLVNLLSNAVKFTPQGGEIGLDVAGDKVRKQVRFTVWDRGIGIDEKQQKQLFKPFV